MSLRILELSAIGATTGICLYEAYSGDPKKALFIPIIGSGLYYMGKGSRSERLKNLGTIILGTSLLSAPGMIATYAVQTYVPGDAKICSVGAGAIVSGLFSKFVSSQYKRKG